MRHALLRLGFPLLLLASVAIRHHAISDRDSLTARFDIGAAIADVVAAHGMTLLENPVRPPRVLSSIVYFVRPGCAQPSLAMPFSLNYQALPLLNRVIKPDYRHRFLYLDRAWPRQARFEMLLVWLEHAVLSVGGASRFVPVKTAIVLADHMDCSSLDGIAWELVWQRGRHRNAIETKWMVGVERTLAGDGTQ
jgi:hypothetical protein